MVIDGSRNDKNQNYLGYDENHNGEFDEWFSCPKCNDNNYITLNQSSCDVCGEKLEWVNDKDK